MICYMQISCKKQAFAFFHNPFSLFNDPIFWKQKLNLIHLYKFLRKLILISESIKPQKAYFPKYPESIDFDRFFQAI